MNDAKAIDALNQLGLTQYEAKVYLALQGEDAAPVSRLQRKSGVPSGGVYTALAGLVERGFAELVLGTKKAYRGVPVEQALSNHQRRLDQQIEEMKLESELKLASARELLASLNTRKPEPPGDPTSLGIRLMPSKNATEFFKELAATGKEFLACVTAPAIVKESDSKSRATRAKRKNTRFVVDRVLADDAETGEAAIKHAVALGNTRFADELPMRFTVFDRKVVILEMVEPDQTWQLLVVPNEALALNLAQTFERIWDRAIPAEKLLPKKQNRTGA